MPTLFVVNGYRFFFFSNEGKEPVHIHVEKGEKYAKFWLEPLSLARNNKFNTSELSHIREIIKKRKNEIEEKWHDYFGI